MSQISASISAHILRAAAAILTLGVAGCGAAPALDAPQGEKPTFVSLNPCTDAILAEVADADEILALSHYSHDPKAASMDVERAREFSVTGGTVEEIIALKPDHVLASSFIAPAQLAALTKFGRAPVTFGIASDADTSAAQIDEIAQLAGHPARGNALIARIEKALDDAPAGPDISAVLWQPGQIVPGRGALISQLMAASGFANYASEKGMQQADFLSLEVLLSDAPDVLLVAGDNAAQKHPALTKLPDTKIAQFDPALLYCGGPTIIHALDRLREIRTEIEKGR